MSFFSIFEIRKPSVIAVMVANKLFRARLKNFDNLSNLFKNKTGIEIGGPNPYFTNKGYMPIYALVKNIDGCNFSTQTIWEGEISEG